MVRLFKFRLKDSKQNAMAGLIPSSTRHEILLMVGCTGSKDDGDLNALKHMGSRGMLTWRSFAKTFLKFKPG